MSVIIKLRGDTEANWQSINPVLADREVALSVDTLNFKVGDGSSDWQSLGYWLPDGLVSVIKIASGNVGIGTIPGYLIHVYRSDSYTGPSARIDQAGGGDAALAFVRPGAVAWMIGLDQSNSNAFRISTSTVSFDTNNALTILSTPFVGIGHNPTTRLDVGPGSIELDEMTPPASPAANNIRIYAKDNGSGKTQLAVKFSDGTETILATQP